ncbi:MAG TPA: RodZ domain-containing protein [Thermoanaerobaculia bacterium]
MPEQNPQPHSELASFGEELRREREIRGISLKEIADSTKISRRFLEAIERNDHKTLPAPVFTRGFVREYARYLGLNTEEIVNRYNYAAAGDDRIEKSDHLDRLVHPPVPEPSPAASRPLPQTAEAKPRSIPRVSSIVNRGAVITMFIIAALAAVTWWAITNKRMRETRAEPVVPIANTITAPAPRAAQPTTEQTAVDDSRLYLKMEVTNDSWVVLDVDGENVINDVVTAGSTRTFEADKEFRFRSIGNAAGLRLTLNETALPALGEDGEVVRNRIIDRAYLDRVRGTANAGVTTS